MNVVVKIMVGILGSKIAAYILGIKFHMKPMYSNEGPSNHTWILCCC